ncbi:MAG: DUF3332 domain-containing protein [Muribaculaceae bacterium]|nr:DUF3332 domain-containing protein [Muribaculaceae bacterium]
MKKKIFSVGIIAALCGSMLFTSCIGSFQLTNKLLSWNKSISNKFVNELVFIAFWVLPVYEVSGLADFLVLNSIEFWSGSSPLAYGKYKLEGDHGERYIVECNKKGYIVTDLTHDTTFRFGFNPDTKEWSYDANGQKIVFMTFIDDNHIQMPLPDGQNIVVTPDASGLYAYEAQCELHDA